jgi:hypothetical protein
VAESVNGCHGQYIGAVCWQRLGRGSDAVVWFSLLKMLRWGMIPEDWSTIVPSFPSFWFDGLGSLGGGQSLADFG